MDENTPNQEIDLATLGCRVVDVHNAIQGALNDFTTGGGDSLESLVELIQAKLGDVPVFVIGSPASAE